MVSIKRFMTAFQAFACLMLLSSAALCAISNPDLDIVIKECEGSYESKVACDRTLGDGTTQTGSGWCKCSGGKLSGGCTLPAATYTEERVNLYATQCRTCTVPAVTKGCGGITQIVDETPTCGDWHFCAGDIVIDPEEPIEKECTSGEVQYKPKGDCDTSTKTCCANGKWSEWDAECSASSSCSANECWNGSICEKKGDTSRVCLNNINWATGGTQTRTATCTSSGWSYGNWSGTCTCKTGYTWSSNSCVPSTPGSSCNCTSNEKKITYADGSCCCEFATCGQTTSSGLVSKCKCTAESIGTYRWVAQGGSCAPKYSCIDNVIPTCDARELGHYHYRWKEQPGHIWTCNGDPSGYCEEILCTQ